MLKSSICTKGIRVAFIVVALTFGLAGNAFGAGEIVVTVLGGEVGARAELTLTAPDGSTQHARDDDGDGSIVVRVAGGGGDYEIRLTLGGASADRTLTVPASGQLALVFDPAAEEKIQVAYSAGNEEIFVTARKRAENLQQTPISIAAFTGEAIEELNIRDLSDVADFTANLDFATTSYLGGATDTATVYIRGIGQITHEIWADPAVGIYIDGVYLARAQGAVMDLIDTERVEVLRGPQGTLFGKNTIGGALSIVTKKPSSAFGGHAELTAGSFNRLNGNFRLNGGLSDKAFASLAVASNNADGFMHSRYTGEDYADDNTDSGRAALRWQVAEGFTLDWAADATRSRERAADLTFLGVMDTPLIEFYNAAMAAGGFELYDDRWNTGDLHESYSSIENFANSDIFGTSLDAAWMLGIDLALRSITAYRESEVSESNDFDGSPRRISSLPTTREQEQWSEEVQLSGISANDRLAWVVGGIYFEEEAHAEQNGEVFGDVFAALEAAPGPIVAFPFVPQFLCNPGPPPPGVPCLGGAGNPLNLLVFAPDDDDNNVSDPSTVSWAVFGEGNLSLGDRTTLTAGLRYTSEDKEFLFRQFPDPGVLTTEEYRQKTWEVWTPRLSLAFQANNETMLYLSLAKGFKSGGFSGLFGDNDQFLEPFRPEEVWTYEAGLKADFVGNRLRLNTALFFNDYTDLQMTASLVVDGQPVFVVQNAGKAEIQGFEMDLQARFTERFGLTVGVGYTDAEFAQLDPAVISVPSDGTVPRTPKWNVVVSPEYSIVMQNGGSFMLRADYSYRSKFYNDISNTEGVATPGYDLVNARASWILPSGKFELFAYGTNLEDEEYLEHGLFPAAFGVFLGVAGRPREWGAGLKYYL